MSFEHAETHWWSCIINMEVHLNSIFFFETGSYHIALLGLELAM